MLCIRPFRRPRQEFGCGQCLPCRINRKRTWAARIVLEAHAHQFASFVTLTYSDEHLPPSNSLSRDHWRQFTKAIGYRYFGCGEYGEKFGRPHYHFILFGLRPSEAEAFCSARWPYGFVSVRPFVEEHAAYVAAYTVKKLTRSSDERLSPGQIPEFARMSRRPGIGVPGLRSWLNFYGSGVGRAAARRDLDVGQVVKIKGRPHPIGRLLRDRLRQAGAVPADDPRRTYARESWYRAQQMSPALKKAREDKRVVQYEAAKLRAARGKGTL